ILATLNMIVMKKSVFIFVLLCQFGLFAQNPDLFNRSWYVTEMQIDGEMVPIPDIPFDRPEGCVVGLRMYGANPYEEGIADLAICIACSADLSDITNTEFKSTGVACLACMDCGPCNPNYSYPNCGMFSEFEGKQIGFFEVIYPEYELISYEIEDLGNVHLSLTLSKENVDYIIYGTEEVLAINEHSISQLAIYPNPSSDKFTLSYS